MLHCVQTPLDIARITQRAASAAAASMQAARGGGARGGASVPPAQVVAAVAATGGATAVKGVQHKLPAAGVNSSRLATVPLRRAYHQATSNIFQDLQYPDTA